MSDPVDHSLDFAALLPGVGVFGGVRRFVEIGNELVRRGHRFVIYHHDGTSPEWLEYLGEVKALSELPRARHQIVLCNDSPLLGDFVRTDADLKLFYVVLEKIREERDIVTHADFVILANSTGIYQRLRKKYRVDAEKVIGGIDLQVFKPRAAAHGEAPSREHLDPAASSRPFRVMAYGRISRSRKGVPLVIQTVESLSRKLANRSQGEPSPPFELVLFDHIGPGNETDPRQEIHSSLPLEFHLNLKQEQLAQLYSSCDLLLGAERRAGWSNVVAEAMACGLPVVCTSSGTVDIAHHRETAWVARWRHPWFLERGLRAMHDDSDLRSTLRDAALRGIQEYSWPRVVDQLEDVVRRKLPLAAAVKSRTA